MEQLRNKTAVVTGGARRLGRAIALALAREGADIVVHYATSSTDAESVAHEIEALGARAWTVQGDLADPDRAADVLEKAWSAAGKCDILVSNAAIFPGSTFADFTAKDVRADIDLNALSPALLARALYAKGRAGAVVNMLDCRIADYDKQHLSYHLSKRLLFTLTRIMAVEFAPRIRVNAVAPGLVLPPAGKDMSYLEGLVSSTLLGTHGNADDVAAATLFLLKSDFVTGQVIFVDGGRNLRGSMYGG